LPENALEPIPVGRCHLIERDLLEIEELEHVLIEKVVQVFQATL